MKERILERLGGLNMEITGLVLVLWALSYVALAFTCIGGGIRWAESRKKAKKGTPSTCTSNNYAVARSVWKQWSQAIIGGRTSLAFPDWCNFNGVEETMILIKGLIYGGSVTMSFTDERTCAATQLLVEEYFTRESREGCPDNCEYIQKLDRPANRLFTCDVEE